jgi:hypothetical protein
MPFHVATEMRVYFFKKTTWKMMFTKKLRKEDEI